VNNYRFRVFMNFVVTVPLIIILTWLGRRHLAPTHEATSLVSSRWERPVSIFVVRTQLCSSDSQDAWQAAPRGFFRASLHRETNSGFGTARISVRQGPC
jgi:hypothetical protein